MVKDLYEAQHPMRRIVPGEWRSEAQRYAAAVNQARNYYVGRYHCAKQWIESELLRFFVFENPKGGCQQIEANEDV